MKEIRDRIAALGPGRRVIAVAGAPGSGKTMLARRLPTILPPLSREEALETTKIHSVAGKAGVTGGPDLKEMLDLVASGGEPPR